MLVERFDALGVSAVGYEGKHPRRFGWGDLKPNSAQQYFRRDGSPLNIGWIMGEQSGCLVDFDIDIDDPVLVGKAVEVLRSYGAVFVGRGGAVRHAMFRYRGRPLSDQLAIKLARHDSAGHIEWRRGGRKPDGTLKTIQSFVEGTHPSGEKLEWMEGTEPHTADDFTTLDWSELDDLWQQLQTQLQLEERVAKPASATAARPRRPKTRAERLLLEEVI